MNYYSQVNGNWKNDKVGNGTATISQVGCLLVCLSNLLKIEPGKLNTIITA